MHCSYFQGNKGAVTIRLSIYGCSVCFVNCHLTPHDHMLRERITDYNNIVKSQLFRVKETSNIFFHELVYQKFGMTYMYDSVTKCVKPFSCCFYSMACKVGL